MDAEDRSAAAYTKPDVPVAIALGIPRQGLDRAGDFARADLFAGRNQKGKKGEPCFDASNCAFDIINFFVFSQCCVGVASAIGAKARLRCVGAALATRARGHQLHVVMSSLVGSRWLIKP